MKILGSSQAGAGFPIVISVSWGLIPSHAPRRAPSLRNRQGTDVVHRPRDGHHYRESVAGQGAATGVPGLRCKNYQAWQTSKKQQQPF